MDESYLKRGGGESRLWMGERLSGKEGSHEDPTVK